MIGGEKTEGKLAGSNVVVEIEETVVVRLGSTHQAESTDSRLEVSLLS